MKTLSFVIPTKDEEETLEELCLQILQVVAELGPEYEAEIIFVDDGSRDRTWDVMSRLAAKFEGRVCALRLRRNFGKAAALDAGFRHSTGNIIFTMDADLQDDPSEIPKFIEMLGNDYDMVSGWKRNRRDPLSKTLPSRLFNWVTGFATGLRLHDFNCGFKAYRREVIESISLYGELHRYIPVLVHYAGFRVGEVEVRHHPRRHGNSKYGLERYLRGLLDLMTVLAITRWAQRPGHLFGGIGLAAGTIGGLMLCYLTVLWFLGLGPIGNRPLLFMGIMLCILSVQMISLGLLSELLIGLKNTRNLNWMISAKYRAIRERPISDKPSTAETD